MATIVNVDIIDKAVPLDNHRDIAVINQPNPCYNYPINYRTALKLIQLANYWIYETGTNKMIDGVNFYEYFPDAPGGGGGGGGGVTPAQVQAMIDASVDPLGERVDKIEDEIVDIEQAVSEYTKGELLPLGRIVYVIPGQLYQATKEFTTNNDPSLTVAEALAADVAAGNLTPVTDADVSALDDRVDTLEEWKPGVDDDISYLKTAIADAEEMEYYATFDAFPAEGEDDITYVDKSTGKTYTWNATTKAYELMNTNNIVDGSIFNSIL